MRRSIIQVLLFAFSAQLPAFAGSIVAVPLPDPDVPDFHFPESEATIDTWTASLSAAGRVQRAAAAHIRAHAWGLWAALTQSTGQSYERQSLSVFETWYTPGDLAALMASGTGRPSLADRPRASLRPLRQSRSDPLLGAEGRAAGFVKYDPSAANHIVAQQLLSVSTLASLQAGGAQGVPPFPSTALVVKAVYWVVAPADLVGGRFYPLPVWTGPPAQAIGWGPSQWPSVAWIDFAGGGLGTGAVDTQPSPDGSSRTEESTYPVSCVLYLRLSPEEAATLNADRPGASAAAGDFALLVGMHVTSRETARWTWQTFWWTPNPDDPPAPSSRASAAARPRTLAGARAHYALSYAYSTNLPAPPVVGGGNAAPVVYAFNPYIEAEYRPADLPDSVAGLAPDGAPAPNDVGSQSNCMSCHAQATYHAAGTPGPRFSGARYVDLADPRFEGTLQTDFLWSLPNEAQ